MAWNFSEELRRWGPQASPPIAMGGLARSYCAGVVRSHYENFSVVSFLLPRRLIRHFHAIYAYCRWSDDLADETAGGQDSLDLLAWWGEELFQCYGGVPQHPVMIALRDTIRRFKIPKEPFLNLLAAFEQDQRVKRYDTFEQLLGYCRNSASPVGHLVLSLFECLTPERAALSGEVCTGLQLANFWQDVARDFDVGRVYIPAEDRVRFGYTDSQLNEKTFSPQFRELMRFEIDRAQGYFDRGEKLIATLPREAQATVELFILGGRAILREIERRGYDVWSRRPEVSGGKKAWLMARTLFRRFAT